MHVSSPFSSRSLDSSAESASPAGYAFRLVASQAVLGFAWTGVALLLGFATKVLLTRRMPAADLGIVLTAQAFTGLVLVAAELGLPDAVVRYVGAEASPLAAPRRTVYGALWVVSISALVTSGVVLGALFLWFGSTMSTDALWTTAILTVGLPLLAAGDVLGAAYRGAGRLGTKLFLIDVVRPGIVAVALLSSPLALGRRAPYVAGLYVLGALLVLASLWGLVRRDRHWRNFGASTSSELLHFGVPVAGAALLAGPLVNSLLPMMLSAWTGSAAVAFYGVALALQGVAGLPLGIFEQVLVPIWARAAAQKKDDLARSYQHYTSICFAVAAGLGICLIANDRAVLSFLFGGGYAVAGPALQYAVVATLCAAWAGPNEAMLRAIGLSRPIFAARLTTAVAGTASAALLIPRYGLMGGITSFAVAVVVLNLVYGTVLYRARGIHPFTSRHVATAIAALAAILAATGVHNDHQATGWVIAHILAILIVAANANVGSTLGAVRGMVVTYR